MQYNGTQALALKEEYDTYCFLLHIYFQQIFELSSSLDVEISGRTLIVFSS